MRTNKPNLSYSQNIAFSPFSLVFQLQQNRKNAKKVNNELGTITDETHIVSRKILARMIVKPIRQHEACEYVVKDSVSIKKATTVFYWLRDRGYIRKIGSEYCSPFELTEKGKLFLKTLTCDS